MQIGYTPEQDELRATLRAYYDDLLTPLVEEELSESHGIGPTVRRIVKQMASDRLAQRIRWPRSQSS